MEEINGDFQLRHNQYIERIFIDNLKTINGNFKLFMNDAIKSVKAGNLDKIKNDKIKPIDCSLLV